MQSHTVPKKLLEQFAFDDPITRSKRLWRYEKARPPYGRAAPKTATRWAGHFADPDNSLIEEAIETELKREFEDPVNQFIDDVGLKTFALLDSHLRLFTGYITSLFHRSRSRREATRVQTETKLGAFQAVLSDDRMLLKLAEKFTMDGIAYGHQMARAITKEEVADSIRKTITAHSSSSEMQRDYVRTIKRMMSFLDETLMAGQWNIISATPDNPFVIGDAPVVTWVRTDRDVLVYGQGFREPNVEVVLPLSPTAALHVLPSVEQTRPVATPTTDEVNIGQAALATAHCFTNISSSSLDALLQPHFGKIRIGVEGFSIRHIDYKDTAFNILMNRGRSLHGSMINRLPK